MTKSYNTNYAELIDEISGLLDSTVHRVTQLANVSAAIFQALEDINWAGFYLLEDNKLYLGPFQGKPACESIPVGRGVCGTAVSQTRTLIVDDVHDFPGHIACDADSRSEIVVPILKSGKPIAVLDIDSPCPSRFSDIDKINLEKIAAQLSMIF